MWYSTSNIGWFLRYFWITIPGRVICRSLEKTHSSNWEVFEVNKHMKILLLTYLLLGREPSTRQVRVWGTIGIRGKLFEAFPWGQSYKTLVWLMSWPLPLSCSFYLLCLAKGVSSPVPPYHGYLKPSHSIVIVLIYLVSIH